MSYNVPYDLLTSMRSDIAGALQVTRGTYTLADNQAAWADVPFVAPNPELSWTTATTYAIYIVYAIRRGANPEVETGQMSIAIREVVAEAPLYIDAVTTTVANGVSLQGTVAAGVAKVQYQTTNTGSTAIMDVIIIKAFTK